MIGSLILVISNSTYLKNRYVDQLYHDAFSEENYKFFSDQKILGLLSFLQENLDKELSNKVISNHLNISEDYVGQFFKNSIGFSPQDYIEHKRMERAIELLREDENAVKVISNEVGYKDTAYFCRRFKLMFGVQAGKMRKRLGEI